MSKLRDALRAKYPTPAAAVRALGLDESILDDDDVTTLRALVEQAADPEALYNAMAEILTEQGFEYGPVDEEEAPLPLEDQEEEGSAGPPHTHDPQGRVQTGPSIAPGRELPEPTGVPSDHAMLREASTAVTGPRSTLPFASAGSTRASASQLPTSSQGKSPRSVITRVLRSKSATSIATGATWSKKAGTLPSAIRISGPEISGACIRSSSRKRRAVQANSPLFQSAPEAVSASASARGGFSTNRTTR